MCGLHDVAFPRRSCGSTTKGGLREVRRARARPAVRRSRALDGLAASFAAAHAGAGDPAAHGLLVHERAPACGRVWDIFVWPPSSLLSASAISTAAPNTNATAAIAPTNRG